MKFVLQENDLDWFWELRKNSGVVVALSPKGYGSEEAARAAIRTSRKGMQGARFAKVEKES